MTQNAGTLEDDEIPDISVQLTPRPSGGTDVSGQRSLNGTWDFCAASGDEPPDDGRDWRQHEVPGQWNCAEYEVASGERGWYRREFSVPPAAMNGRIRIRFDGVYSDAVVWVNGDRVGTHVGGYTPFEVDITDAVTAGDRNVLEVGVAEASVADEMSQANYGGGITRDVTLLTTPACHLSDLDIETTLDADGEQATISTQTLVTNTGVDRVDDAELHLRLIDPRENEVATVNREIADIAAGSTLEIETLLTLEEFITWNPERPHCYDLTVELQASGELERVKNTIGIRQLEVDGNQIRLNGREVTLRGVNWRECDPDRGIAITAERARRDAERLRKANVNYVRTGHHPPSEAFVEACDELGIIVELESPVAFLRFDNAHKAHDPTYREAICRQILEAVERDKNRTSVCLWSLSNESEWGTNFEAAARLVSSADPTRLRTFNWGMHKDEDAPFCDIANHHYPALRDSTVDLEVFEDSDRPVLFGEFAHLYCYNGQELSTDPGLRDGYVRVLEACWDRVRELDAFAGAAIWAGLDHLIPEYRWGVVDKYRRPRPEYWHIKKIYSPVRVVSSEWDDRSVSIELENRGEFVNLSERYVEWRAGDESGVLDVDIGPGETGSASVPTSADVSEVSIAVFHPDGFTIDEFTLEQRERGIEARRDRNSRDSTSDSADPVVSETDGNLRLEVDSMTVAVDRYLGEITVTGPNGETIMSGLPGHAATSLESNISVPPEYNGAIGARQHPWRCEDVRVTDDGAGIEVEGGYYYDTIDVGEGSFTFRFTDDGRLEIEYGFTPHEDRTVRELGVVLPVVADCQTLLWTRNSRWSTYPQDHIGRQRGTARPFPGGDRPSDDVPRLDRLRPWAADTTSLGSNDFRSTKRNVETARLDAEDGRGLEVDAGGDQHVRCAFQGETIDLHVLDRSFAGAGLGLLDRHDLLDEHPVLEEGVRYEGAVTVRPISRRDR